MRYMAFVEPVRYNKLNDTKSNITKIYLLCLIVMWWCISHFFHIWIWITINNRSVSVHIYTITSISGYPPLHWLAWNKCPWDLCWILSFTSTIYFVCQAQPGLFISTCFNDNVMYIWWSITVDASFDSINTLRLWQNGPHNISQTTLSNAFSWMKLLEFP